MVELGGKDLKKPRNSTKLHSQIILPLFDVLVNLKDTRHPDDGGSKHLWNAGKLLPDYTP
jgi:hypothetical protein